MIEDVQAQSWRATQRFAMKHQAAIITAYLALSAATGVFEAFLRMRAEDLRIAAVSSLFPSAILLFSWCKADCARRAISPPGGAALLVAGAAVIGIPYYYFRILPPFRALIYVLCAYLVLGLGMGATVWADLGASRVFSS
jgi:hypothetical protein